MKKIGNIEIDFDHDNILPGLNKEDLAELGKEDKPVLLKKSVIERNMARHPDIGKEEFAKLLAETLYSPDFLLPERAKPEKASYRHFIKYLERDNSIVLVEMSDIKKNYEVVHLQKVRSRNLKSLIKRNK